MGDNIITAAKGIIYVAALTKAEIVSKITVVAMISKVTIVTV
jgi:hypothetical protein